MPEITYFPLKPTSIRHPKSTTPPAILFGGRNEKKKKAETGQDTFIHQSHLSPEDQAVFDSLPPIVDLEAFEKGEVIEKNKEALTILPLDSEEPPPTIPFPDTCFPPFKKQRKAVSGAPDSNTNNELTLALSQPCVPIEPQNLPPLLDEKHWKALLDRVFAGNGKSAVSAFFSRLNQKGIDGRGVRIIVLEPPNQDQHSKQIASIIQDKYWGIAPKSSVHEKTVTFPPEKVVNWSSLKALEKDLKHNLKGNMKALATQLSEITNTSEQRTIVNMSFGDSPIFLANELFENLNKVESNTFFSFPQLREDVVGKPGKVWNSRNHLRLIREKVQRIYESSGYKEGLSIYRKAVREAADRGVFVVVAAGNNHNEKPFPADSPISDLSELMDYAKSTDVISVAATNTNDQPDDFNHHTLAGFSSRGDGRRHNPTVAAPGENIYVNPLVDRLDSRPEVSGTSFSAPYVSGLLARMLQIKPDLTPREGKAILEQTAANPKGYSKAEVGAGLVNPKQAIRRTMREAGWNDCFIWQTCEGNL